MVDEQRIVAINVTVGTLALAVAALWPFADHFMTAHNSEVGVVKPLTDVVAKERQFFDENHRYVTFSSLEADRNRGLKELALPPTDFPFTLEAFVDGDAAALVVRGYPVSTAIAREQATAVLYEHRIITAGQDGSGRWAVAP